jgi:hypothetical protein
MKEIELLTIEFILHIFHKIKQKMLIKVFGPLIFPKLDLDQEESIISIIFAQVIISSLHLEWMYQKEKALTHIMII